ncbi:NUDIX hydrolase [Candidatus Acetothermia bacterium]|nr:NUDIX hydrolase [Candidatus Acetothermia bacterium]
MPEMKFCPQCAQPLAQKELSGQMRMACSSEACGYVSWNNPTPVVAAIVEHDEKVLLVRNKGWPEKWFGLVSGFLEKDETPEAAILREVKEEVGLDGEIVRLVGIYSFFEMNQLILAYHVRARGEVRVGEELAAVKHIHPDELRPWPRGTGPAVRDWLEARKKAAQ